MSIKPRRSLLGQCDDLVFAYAGLFLLCALVSSLGGGVLGLLIFIPAAVAATLLVPGRRRY